MEKTHKQRRNVIIALCCLVMAVAGFTGLLGLAALQFLVLLPAQTYESMEEMPWLSLNAKAFNFKTAQDFLTAESRLKQAMASTENRDNPIPSFLLAGLYQTTHRNPEALQAYEKSLQVIAAYQPTWYGEILYRSFLEEAHAQRAVLYFQAHQPQKAQAELAQVVDIESSENPQLLEALKGVLEAPNRADAHFLLGVALRHELHLPEARHEFEQAIALSTDPTLKLSAQNYLKMKMPHTSKAISPLVLYYSKAGDAYEADGQDLVMAADYYEKAIELDPEFEWPYYHLGMIYHELKDEGKTVEYAEKAIKLNQNFFLPYLALGDVALNQANYPQAVKHYSKALELGSQLSDEEDTSIIANIENQLGYAFEQMHDKTVAISHYNKAMELSDENSEDYQYAEGSIERVRQDLQKQLSLISENQVNEVKTSKIK